MYLGIMNMIWSLLLNLYFANYNARSVTYMIFIDRCNGCFSSLSWLSLILIFVDVNQTWSRAARVTLYNSMKTATHVSECRLQIWSDWHNGHRRNSPGRSGGHGKWNKRENIQTKWIYSVCRKFCARQDSVGGFLYLWDFCDPIQILSVCVCVCLCLQAHTCKRFCVRVCTHERVYGFVQPGVEY